MFVLLIRLVLILLIVFIIYRIFKYLLNPKRKLELAHEKKEFYFLDDQKNVQKNFLLTYKGVLFEGEKYLGTTDKAFEVISIFVFTKHIHLLKGIYYDDFKYLERRIKEVYPHAVIDWKSPIKEFLTNNTRER
ncbi:sigma-w pathway protein ysdB [Fredinandcohnia quinoae]|uniref:Sigma-w pathway protein ysdB n=1 Tax=Fredinandcohnia quinoae TaxID=2918902 RepID=A0AAW5ECA3_9BACI|nr:sigma-w pathway protein ysdB [Fredinandcohnia sp. SECRCQ15]MCH1627310.1 sigma-w pathway protein ysdB [Fredinandcohnia sp. SECRCQ15]